MSVYFKDGILKRQGWYTYRRGTDKSRRGKDGSRSGSLDRRTRDEGQEKQEWKTGEAGMEGRIGTDRRRKTGIEDSD